MFPDEQEECAIEELKEEVLKLRAMVAHMKTCVTCEHNYHRYGDTCRACVADSKPFANWVMFKEKP